MWKEGSSDRPRTLVSRVAHGGGLVQSRAVVFVLLSEAGQPDEAQGNL